MQSFQRTFVPFPFFALVFCMSCDDKPSPEGVGEAAPLDKEKPQPQAKTPDPPKPAVPPPWATRVSPDGGFPCDVDEVLANSCRRCHWDPQENDAPFPLVKFEDTREMRSGKPIFKLMEQMVAADLMPPLGEPVEPKVTPLSPAQKDTLLKWLGAGAPKNEEKCGG